MQNLSDKPCAIAQHNNMPKSRSQAIVCQYEEKKTIAKKCKSHILVYVAEAVKIDEYEIRIKTKDIVQCTVA